MRHAIACACLCTGLKQRRAKKACLVSLIKLQRFLSFTFYKVQRSCEKIMCVCYFIGSVVKFVLHLHFLYTKKH